VDMKTKGKARILLNDEIMEMIMPPLIEEVMGPSFDFDVVKTTYADEILEAAAHQSFDLFAFLLNNIIFRKEGMPSGSSSRKALQLVTHLEARYKTPIIAFYGHPKGPAYARQAKLAGADFAFQIPCTWEVLKEPIRTCLEGSLLRNT
jgi:hypothetical protein